MRFFGQGLRFLNKHKKIKLAAILIVLLFCSLALYKLLKPNPVIRVAPIVVRTASVSKQYKRPILPKSQRYDIYLVGDSMTRALGPRGGIFTELIRKEYPGIFIEVSNYAKSENLIEFLSRID